MRITDRFSTIICLILFSSAAVASAGESPLSKWRAEVSTTAKKHASRGVRSGVCVIDLRRNIVAYSNNADKYFIPASLVKIFITAAALETLGPAFMFRAEAYSEARITGGKVRHLYFKGDCNPKLAIEQLWLLPEDCFRL